MTVIIQRQVTFPHPSQILLPLIHTRQNSTKRTHRRREKVLAALRDHERAHGGVQLHCPFRILREQTRDIYLLAFTQLAQKSVETDSWPDEVPLVSPLALNESEAVADGALVADEEEAAGAGGIGLELVALVVSVLPFVQRDVLGRYLAYVWDSTAQDTEAIHDPVGTARSEVVAWVCFADVSCHGKCEVRIVRVGGSEVEVVDSRGVYGDVLVVELGRELDGTA